MQGREKKPQIKCEELLRDGGQASKSGAENHVITKTHCSPSSKIVPFGSLHLEEVRAEEKAQSRDMTEPLDEQDRTLQAGNGPAEDGSLQNSGRLNRMERGKLPLPTQDEDSRYITPNQKTEAFFARGVIRLQQLLLQDAVVTKSSAESRKQSGMEKGQEEQNNIEGSQIQTLLKLRKLKSVGIWESKRGWIVPLSPLHLSLGMYS